MRNGLHCHPEPWGERSRTRSPDFYCRDGVKDLHPSHPPGNGDSMKESYVYIMTNRRRGVLYVGVTNDLSRRVNEHREGIAKGFTSRYHLCHLVYFETFGSIIQAIAREKEIKGWVRRKKIVLIEKRNPAWRDLHEMPSVHDCVEKCASADPSSRFAPPGLCGTQDDGVDPL